ncbi:hypothetical protein HMI54_007458 [Coelomomyces lativittatus]|nr:hypothetical protein HMI54_007458 [Coelomomyces lativittatus]
MVQSTYTKNSVCLSTDQENNAIQQCFGHSNLFTSIDTLKEHYESSLPFTHLKLSNFVDPDLLEEVRTEILEHLHFTEKETDIYQVR